MESLPLICSELELLEVDTDLWTRDLRRTSAFSGNLPQSGESPESQNPHEIRTPETEEKTVTMAGVPQWCPHGEIAVWSRASMHFAYSRQTLWTGCAVSRGQGLIFEWDHAEPHTERIHRICSPGLQGRLCWSGKTQAAKISGSGAVKGDAGENREPPAQMHLAPATEAFKGSGAGCRACP